MSWLPLTISGKRIRLHKSFKNPDFTEKTILVEDPWDYVDLWLNWQKSEKASFYWKQARAFYEASKNLPKSASPLTIYYSALNAVKTLLIAKDLPYKEAHGICGERKAKAKTSLANEMVKLSGAGVATAFCKYLGEPVDQTEYTLKDIFYNLPFIHRAYSVTFSSEDELFVPIDDPIFVRQKGSHDACFRCGIRDKKYQSSKTLNTLKGFEKHLEADNKKYLVRFKNRFQWNRHGSRQNNLDQLKSYHMKIRRRTVYIKGISRLWYLKRSNITRLIDRSSMSLILMAMHRLSELSRYTPDQLEKHFKCQHNYLLSQFLNRSLDQFIDELSAELTGNEFMSPGYVGN